MWKQCSRCLQPKNLEEFAKRTKTKDGLQSICKPCMSEVMALRYHQDREKWQIGCNVQIRRKYEWINTVKSERGCLCCGEIDYSALDFHHADESAKSFEISAMVKNKASDERIKDEIEKCVVLCATCHRKVHAGSILLIVE